MPRPLTSIIGTLFIGIIAVMPDTKLRYSL